MRNFLWGALAYILFFTAIGIPIILGGAGWAVFGLVMLVLNLALGAGCCIGKIISN